MADADADDALEADLLNRRNMSALNVLAKEHAEDRGGQRGGLILLGQIDKGKRGVGRYQKTAVACGCLDGQLKL
ncbi:hypothetical protein GCWU000342_01200 [Shuttleworthella satelles DSM 14600]|uniref:Uncharacterized protein n=1 Tax=Shuttleworthella satelles DSM 14600 TaxID=626523 RepID=C4GB99_9FIRM|nr:hypothetical protein GCWU000342_01200 [Shuttleworthia satelles DSM 14600]